MPDQYPSLPSPPVDTDHDAALRSTVQAAHRGGGHQEKRRRTLVIASVAALTALGVAALTFSARLSAPAGISQQGPGTVAAAPTSTSPTAEASKRAFTPFDRPEYPQEAALDGATGAVPATLVKVHDEGSGASLAEGLMGFSFEADSMADVRFEPGASTFVQELKKLHKPVVRFGGQAVDRRFFWTSKDEAIPSDWKLVPAFAGDKRPIVKVTPQDLERLNRMAVAADARILLTADLGHFDPTRAGDLARNAANILGDRLLGITVGNEPNGYYVEGNQYLTLRANGWNDAQYLEQFEAYSSEITRVAPSVKLVGPGAYNINWLKSYAAGHSESVGALSYHNYPMFGCGGPADPDSPTIAHTMSRERADKNRNFVGNVAAVAKSAGLPLWLTEGGLSSCSGSNETSRKHVSALWTAGFALMAAEAGVTQFDVHSAIEACKGGPPGSPVCDTGAYRKPNGVIVGQANLSGMLLVSGLEPGKFLKLDQSGSENVYSYAIAHADGSLSVIIINQNDPVKFGQAPIQIQLPRPAATGTMSQMFAPAFDSEALTRIDGRDDAGTPLEERPRIPGFLAGQESISVPLTSGTATVLRFSF